MKYIHEFRDPEKAKFLLQGIEHLTQQLNATAEHPVRLMEVCGGHTHSRLCGSLVAHRQGSLDHELGRFPWVAILPDQT